MSERQAPEARLRVCPVCGGKGWNKIAYIKEDPRRACTCGRCLGSGRVRTES